MNRKRIRKVVRRNDADVYLMIVLVASAATVIITRVFLELTGYPQIGNDVLHIAHALWGGLLMYIAALLPLVLSNRWVVQASALLCGIGMGLFIDEIGKFITQANDYFFAPSLSIIYGFFLLTIVVYLVFRSPQRQDPRVALYNAIERLEDVLDGHLDATEAVWIEAQLDIAKTSDRSELRSLSDVISNYVREEIPRLPTTEPDLWERFTGWLTALGRRLGRRMHRGIITTILILWVIFVIGYIGYLVTGNNLESHIVRWRFPLIVIQSVVGGLMTIAFIIWVRKNEKLALTCAVGAFLLSLVVLQMLYFYLSQFAAITSTLLQLVFLSILLAYRRRYLHNES